MRQKFQLLKTFIEFNSFKTNFIFKLNTQIFKRRQNNIEKIIVEKNSVQKIVNEQEIKLNKRLKSSMEKAKLRQDKIRDSTRKKFEEGESIFQK